MKKLQRILYAEDDPDIQMIAMMIFGTTAWQVEVCSSGVAAVTKALEFKPDLCVFDVMMPDMDGVTALLQLRKSPIFADTPVIFMTAKVQKSEIDRYMELGALGIIAKPFNPMTLISEIENLYQKIGGI